LGAGAQGYVHKASAQSDLLPAIDAVLRGDRFVSSMSGGHTTKLRRMPQRANAKSSWRL
jgi:DNA-binding NarL/FixJ family response regulator